MPEEPKGPDLRSLTVRVERLEAEIERLRREIGGRGPTLSPPPSPPVARPETLAPSRPPIPAPALQKPPAAPGRLEVARAAPPRERNPVVVIAAVGAGIFLLGAVFLLRFAIEQGWIGPPLRFLFGIVVGVGLALPAARHLRGGSPRVGTALLAAGLGTLVFTLYVGCFRYGFYGREAGFALAAGVCVAGGALAASARVASAFAVTYLAAFAAPFVFASREPRPVALAAYEVTLLVAAVLVAHLAPEARRWSLARWLVLATQGLVLLGTASGGTRGDAPPLLLLLVLALAIGAIWIWRWPAGAAAIDSPTPPWIALSLGAVAVAALHWASLELRRETFAPVLVAFAAVQLLLSRRVRRDPATAGGELGLLLLAGALLAAAVPVAFDWELTGPLWGALAVLALRGSRRLAGRGEEHVGEARALAVTGFALAVGTTLRWLNASGLPAFADPAVRIPFWNSTFLTAVLAAGAWLEVMRLRGAERSFGFAAFEGSAHVAAAYEVALLVGALGGGDRARSVTLTLVWVASGALHWLAGLRRPPDELARGMVATGYCGLAVAAAKLIFVDLDRAPLALRALVFLLAGGIFLGAALWANRLAARHTADS